MAKRSIDWMGAVTLSGAIISLLLAMVLIGNGHTGVAPSEWQSPRPIGLLSASAILVALFSWLETKAEEPIIPLHLFKLPAIAFGNISGFFVSAALFSAIAYIPLFVQGGIGLSPSQAGYLLSPLMLATVVTSNMGGRLMSKVSYRTILLPSLAVMAIGFFLLQLIGKDTPLYVIVLDLIVIGLGMGAVYPTLGTAAVRAVDPVNRGVATSSSQFFRSIGGTIGVSVMGSLLSHSFQALFFACFVFVCVSLLVTVFLGKARLIPKATPD